MERLPAASLAARVAAFSPTSPLVVSVTEALACVPFKLSAELADSLRAYRVPAVVEGACSSPDRLQEAPFELLKALASCGCAAGGEEATLHRLAVLRHVCERLAEVCEAQWAGVYLRVRLPGSDVEALLKLAYIGAPSRALFPLTEEFAAHSNNSTVGLSGDAVVISDVQAMPADSPYYQCDGKVRSELCAPITCPNTGRVLGIVDVEAFEPGTFTPERVTAVLHCCAHLSLLLPSFSD